MEPPNNKNHQKRSSVLGLFGLFDYIEGRKQIFTSQHSDHVNTSHIKVAKLADRPHFVQTIEEGYKPKKRINKNFIKYLADRKNKI